MRKGVKCLRMLEEGEGKGKGLNWGALKGSFERSRGMGGLKKRKTPGGETVG